MKLMELLIYHYKYDSWVKLKHSMLDTGEINGSNFGLVIQWLHEDFDSEQIRTILKEGDFEIISK